MPDSHAKEERTGGGRRSEADPEAGWGMLCGTALLPAQNKLPEGKVGVIFVIWMINAQCSAINI